MADKLLIAQGEGFDIVSPACHRLERSRLVGRDLGFRYSNFYNACYVLVHFRLAKSNPKLLKHHTSLSWPCRGEGCWRRPLYYSKPWPKQPGLDEVVLEMMVEIQKDRVRLPQQG